MSSLKNGERPRFIHFRFAYYNSPRLPKLTGNILSAYSHPMYPKLYERYSQRDVNSLWYMVSANQLQGKKVLRVKAKSKLSIALKETLRACGWDEDGKASSGSAKPSLRGYLELVPFAPAISASQDDLKRDMNILLEYVERKQNGSHGPMKHPLRSFRNDEGNRL